MSGLTTDSITSACRIFFSRAYPNGEDAIPPEKLLFLELPPGRELSEYHADHPLPGSCFQLITNNKGETLGYALRLGSPHFPHLKMKVLAKVNNGERIWVFAVDTHDAFSPDSFQPPPDHPDAERWIQIQDKNNALKRQIEADWEAEGLMTFHALLRQDL